MKFVCTSCGSVYRIENTGGVEPPLNPVLKAEEPCPCPPPHTCEPDWQAAFVEADNARCKVESELEREREISDRFQKENNTLTMKCTALEETLEKEIEEVKQLKDNCERFSQDNQLLNRTIAKLKAEDATTWKVAFAQMRTERDKARVDLTEALNKLTELERKLASLDVTLTKAVEDAAMLEQDLEKSRAEVKLLKQNYNRLEETRNMQLAAISTAAIQNTETTINERLCPSNPYWTVAYKDVCTAVDREMRHRRRAGELEEINRKIRRYLSGFRDCEQENIKHPTPRK